jgi:opacity protein-like surface antigen
VGETTGNVMVEAVSDRTACHDLRNSGRFGNLQADLQPTLDAATAALSANQGLSVIGGGNLPAWYTTGGVRVEVPAGRRILPYVLGSVGVARLNPSAQFTFSSGALPDGSTPNVGADVTSALISTGTYTDPPASTAPMFSFGGGAQIPVAPHWVVDAAYRYSRIAATRRSAPRRSSRTG